MHFFYNGQNGEEHTLRESIDKLIIRTCDGFDPKSLLDHKLIKPFSHRLKLLDYYPEASVYVYALGCASADERDVIKEIFKSMEHPLIQFVGTVMERTDSGVYQIYTGNLFVKFKDEIDGFEQNDVLTRHNLRIKKYLKFTTDGYWLEPVVDAHRNIFDLCLRILEEPTVELCHPELVVSRKTILPTTIPGAVADLDDWAARMIGLRESWKTTKGKGARICIIDDGIDLSHPAFNNRNRFVRSKDMTCSEEVDASHKDDSEMHGTACASIACGDDDEILGVAPEADLLVVRSKGLGSVLESEAIFWAVEHGADIISCSWGPPDGSLILPPETYYHHPLPDHTRLAFEYATTKGRNGKGCLIFFAAGNGNEPVEYDGYACNDYVMAIGAVNKEGSLTTYSDYGEKLFCCFPSSEISIENQQQLLTYGLSVADRLGIKGYSETDYNSGFGGTSASCPGMAGVAALMISANPHLTLNQYKQLMQAACYLPKAIAIPELRKRPGYGIINATKLLELTKNFNITNTLTPMNANNKPKKIAVHVAVDELDRTIYQGDYQDLQGCKNDLNLFRKLTNGIYEQKIFEDKNATRKAILDVLEDLVTHTSAGDEIVFTYSGHGGSIDVRVDSTEDDGKDETLVLHDGMLIDDEIRDVFLRFKKGVKVFWYTDCCHSGTNTRNAATVATTRNLQVTSRNAGARKLYRLMPKEVLNKVYLDNRETYRTNRLSLQNRGSSKSVANDDYAATIIHFAACQDSQYAAEINGFGDFTKKLTDAFDANKSLSYKGLFDQVKKLMSVDQTPMYNKFGPDVEAFGEIPFLNLVTASTENVPTSTSKPKADTVPDTSAFSDLDTCTNLLIQGANSMVEFNVKPTGRGAQFTVRGKSEIRAVDFRGSKIWDKAYDAYNSRKANGDHVFIEPDMASAIFGDPKLETNRSGDGYLDTYPAPESGNELWHLSDNHSQLTKALKHACPQETVLGRNTQDLHQYPLIAHIDTGVLTGGPVSPMNLDLNASFRFDDPIDKDKWYLPDFAEQQGHGNATAAILAGGKLAIPGETVLDANAFYGGFPFARVVTLKISESVAILRGKSFAKALNYAVDVLKADVVTMSMAGAPSKVMLEAVNNAYEKGVIMVCAGGNCWSQGAKKLLPSTLMYPAILNRVIAATGVTLNKTPYLNEFNPVTNRDSGGRFMQSCHGPANAMRTALAAYTPNLLWFSEEGNPYYLKSGGGTSSATPQIAAAAALYCFKYRTILSAVDEPWKKVEAVRQALFRSADVSQNEMFGEIYTVNGREYNQYFGNGMLKAYDALQLDAGDILSEIGQNPNKFKEEKETLGRTGIDDLFKMWFRSAVQPEADNTLKEMVALEIEQLIFTDPELFKFSSEKRLTYELKLKLYESDRTSATLKKLLGKDIGLNNRSNLTRSANIMLQTEIVDLDEQRSIYVSLQNIRGTVTKTNDAITEVHLGGFAVEVDNSTTRGGADPAIEISYSSDDGETMYLVTKEYEDGTKSYSWAETKDGSSRGGGDQLDIYLDDQNVLYIDIPTTRGFFKKIKRFFVNVFRTINDKAASDMQGLLFGEVVNGALQWSEIKNAGNDVKKEIQDQPKTLFLSHGAFSSVEVSFRQLGADAAFLQELQDKNYGKYVLGYNMSSVKSGIEENASDILAALRKLGVDNKKLTIIASSRGCLVARQAFRDGQRMILSAGPHLGTPMASEENISKLINRFTGLVITVSGVSSPVVGVLAFAAKMVIKFFWKMQGVADMAPGSDFVNQLNANVPLGVNNFLIGMNYRGQGLKSALDFANDNLIFGGVSNDMVVPFDSAINNYSNPDNTFFCAEHEDVHHLIYFGDKEIIETVNKWLP
ncbi:S8 family serine peptidase [Dyadobacter sp. CY312]|uniref:S8 family serine peptidase n=1 Tax=Dyadobacter sp. CY312 TaxID=2907303 RepID=UPI001F18C0CE|nr:S8 family serine peptidase [Dyadobacter sp. CY312]MCE7043290.1 S8 family serine peptidase [Dyadobacter sp. CY312]